MCKDLGIVNPLVPLPDMQYEDVKGRREFSLITTTPKSFERHTEDVWTILKADLE